MEELNLEEITKELKVDAKGIGIPSGAASIFVEKALNTAIKKLSTKTIVTEKDLKTTLGKELKKYNNDLAYVYENRDTII